MSVRLLFDECVPRTLRRALPSHECTTVVELGWNGRSDREILRASRGRFDALVTVDHSIPFQQHLDPDSTALVVLRARQNTLAALLPLVAELEAALDRLRPGMVFVVGRHHHDQ